MVATAQAPVVGKTSEYPDKDIGALYERAFPAVAKFVSRMDGSFDQAKDIFHDALVIYMEVATQRKPTIHGSKEAYILGIAKHLWFRKHKREHRHMALSDAEYHIAVPGDCYPDVNTKRLLRFLEQSGKKCMDLLRAFYYQGLPVKKIADDFGYSNEHSASAQKYKCLEKIRNTVKEKSLQYEDFTE